MNDRFRFRVWDKVAKEYNNREYYINMTGGLSRLLPMRRASEVGALSLDNFIIEQCTGRKDINGKLIYEGDIVRAKFAARGRDGAYYMTRGQIYWYGLEIVLKGKDSTCVRLNIQVDIEVIGNIHENPELLK